MPIEPEQLEKFITLYKQEYGIDLTIEQAQEEATKLFNLYKIVYLRT